jgi:hypothetical protein
MYRAMYDVPPLMGRRGVTVAAAGIFIGALCQASLNDSSRCGPRPEVFTTTDDSAKCALSYQHCNAFRPVCVYQPQRPRVVAPEFVHAVEIAGVQRASN